MNYCIRKTRLNITLKLFIFFSFISIGVIQATLEPHMRPFIKNPMIMGE